MDHHHHRSSKRGADKEACLHIAKKESERANGRILAGKHWKVKKKEEQGERRRRRHDDVVACEREQVHVLIRNGVHVLEVPPSVCYTRRITPNLFVFFFPLSFCSLFLLLSLSLSLSFPLSFYSQGNLSALLQKDPFFVYKSHITNDLFNNNNKKRIHAHTQKRERLVPSCLITMPPNTVSSVKAENTSIYDSSSCERSYMRYVCNVVACFRIGH